MFGRAKYYDLYPISLMIGGWPGETDNILVLYIKMRLHSSRIKPGDNPSGRKFGFTCRC